MSSPWFAGAAGVGFSFPGGYLSPLHMPISIPRAAVRAGLPPNLRLQLVSSCAEPPEGEGWLHEIKHDGHRLAALIAGPGSMKLMSRNGIDRTPLFRAPFRELAANGRPLVLDGEIAVPDERGVTHLDALTDALAGGRHEGLAYFAFDLLYHDGHDPRRCPIEERKALLRQVLDEARSERIVYVDHMIGWGRQLFEAVQQIGAEGIVSKRLGRPYRGGQTRDWLKTKCHQVGHFVITGFQELGEGRLEAVHVAEEADGELAPAGQVRYGFAGKGLWRELNALRCGPATKGVIPVNPGFCAEIKFFGRHKGGSIRDGVILSLHHEEVGLVAPGEPRPWSCDSDEAIAAIEFYETGSVSDPPR
jgi:bifunctional non-homologous end joining protein LigD